MFKYIPLIALLYFFAGCNSAGKQVEVDNAKMDSLKAELLRVDNGWSQLSQKKGYYHTRVDYAADSSIEFEEHVMPIIGKAAFIDYSAKHPDSNFCLGWKPLRAEVAASGDLGYTFGAFAYYTKTLFGKDTIFYGNYVTVWRRQPDGKWKFVVDGGTDTPARVESLK